MSDFNEKEINDALLESKESDFKRTFRIKEKRAKVSYDIAAHLIKKYYVKTISGKKLREVFVYREGVYVPGEDILRKEVQELLEELCTTHYSKEIIEIVKNRTVMDRKEFSVDKNLANLNNGVLDIGTGEIAPHNPEHLFFSKIPINYDKSADCPKIKRFLAGIFIQDENKIQIIQEWLGYALYREYFIKKAIIFVGEGNTGKTTLISLSTAFIGKENISSASLQQICSDKFAVAQLYTKHLNICDELSFSNVKDGGKFKIVTGGGIIAGEYKFGDQFVFENYAKLTFACNKIPDVKDANDDAYFSRWIVIQFNKVFTDEEQDKQLIHKLTTAEELSGLLNFVLEGLKRLLKKQGISYHKDPDQIKSEMLRSGSPVANFAYDCLEREDNAWISKENMHATFIEYTRSNDFPADPIEEFGRKLPKYADYLFSSRKQMINTLTGQDKQFTGWRNVRFKIKEGSLQDNKLDPPIAETSSEVK